MSQSNQPSNPNPYSSPVHSSQAPGYLNQTISEGDKTGGVIPYKNPHALFGYYLGIIGLLPVLGLPFGIAAILLGIIGLRKRAANPIIKGSVHAVIAICCGVFSICCGGIFGAGIIISLLGTR
jgi:sorbitol-specific phosphotransferase system component IIC